MGIRETVTLDILSDSEMKSLEQKVVKLEELEKRKDKAVKSIRSKKSKGQGIFSTDSGKEALPSSFLKKRKKLGDSGLAGGRGKDSAEKLVGDRIKADTEEKFNRTEGILSALGLNIKSKKKLTKNSLVSGGGAPIQKSNEFKKLRNEVASVKKNQKALAESLSDTSSLVRGASGLSTPSGIFGAGMGLATKIPHLAAVSGIATALYAKFQSQYGSAGTKDTRKKVLANDVSNIGSELESDIDSGSKLFLSNPLSNQGLPRGNSNTANLRDGTRIHIQRKEGSYL